MSGSTGVLARFLALAFFVIVGIGIYAFIVQTDLQAAQEKVRTIEEERDLWKTRFNQYQEEGQATTANLEQCTAQVNDLQAQIEAAAAKAPARRR